MGLPFDQVRTLLSHVSEPVSLSAPLREDSDGELGDLLGDSSSLSPEEMMLQRALVGEVDKALAPLNDRERAVLRLRYGLDGGEPRTLEAVGASMAASKRPPPCFF